MLKAGGSDGNVESARALAFEQLPDGKRDVAGSERRFRGPR